MENEMVWVVISVVLITLTLCILKDTHVKECYRDYNSFYVKEEYDLKIPLWVALIIFVLGLIPILNIVIFGVFVVVYACLSTGNPDSHTNDTVIPSLRGDNIVTKGLLKIKNLLCRKI